MVFLYYNRPLWHIVLFWSYLINGFLKRRGFHGNLWSYCGSCDASWIFPPTAVTLPTSCGPHSPAPRCVQHDGIASKDRNEGGWVWVVIAETRQRGLLVKVSLVGAVYDTFLVGSTTGSPSDWLEGRLEAGSELFTHLADRIICLTLAIVGQDTTQTQLSCEQWWIFIVVPERPSHTSQWTVVPAAAHKPIF